MGYTFGLFVLPLFLGYCLRTIAEDRALQECNLSAQSARALQAACFGSGLEVVAEFVFYALCNHGIKR
jgi:hypothetical protein